MSQIAERLTNVHVRMTGEGIVLAFVIKFIQCIHIAIKTRTGNCRNTLYSRQAVGVRMLECEWDVVSDKPAQAETNLEIFFPSYFMGVAVETWFPDDVKMNINMTGHWSALWSGDASHVSTSSLTITSRCPLTALHRSLNERSTSLLQATAS